VWPGLLAVLVAAGRPRPLAGRLAVAAAGMAAVPFLVAPAGYAASVYRDWWAALIETRSVRWPGYRDAWTAAEAAGWRVDPAAYRAAQVAGALAVLLACRAPAGPPDRLRVALAGWLCWQLVLGPGTEQNTYGMITPVMSGEALRARRKGQGCAGALIPLAAVIVFTFGDVEEAIARHWSAARAVLPGAVAAFAGWLVWPRPAGTTLGTPGD
jgi:hypothetical protein